MNEIIQRSTMNERNRSSSKIAGNDTNAAQPVNPDIITTVHTRLIHKSLPRAYCTNIEQTNMHRITEKYHMHSFLNASPLIVSLHSFSLHVSTRRIFQHQVIGDLPASAEHIVGFLPRIRIFNSPVKFHRRFTDASVNNLSD